MKYTEPFVIIATLREYPAQVQFWTRDSKQGALNLAKNLIHRHAVEYSHVKITYNDYDKEVWFESTIPLPLT